MSTQAEAIMSGLRVMNQVVDIAVAAARTRAPALDKLDRPVTALHRHNKTKLVEKRRKLTANYLAFIQLVSIRLWLRVNESTP